jgi:phosphate starvation-inducible PhoH-like protein
MKEPNRERKQEIKYNLTLNDEQKEAKRFIIDNQIVVITGRAGCGKSLVSAQTALDFMFKKQCDFIYVTRPTIEVGHSLGFLPGTMSDKFNPYLEAFMENLTKCYDKVKIQQLITDGKIAAFPVQFIRGKTIDDILVVEEAQNLTKAEMLAILTRLGKTGKIIINGDNEQKDIKDPFNGLSYVIEMSKKIKDIKWIKLKHNHRSDLVGKILDFEYGK